MAKRVYSPLRDEVIAACADALASLRQQDADDYNPYEWADGTRFGFLNPVSPADERSAQRDARKLVLEAERKNLWPPDRQDLGLFVEASDEDVSADDLGIAIAGVDVRDYDWLTEEEAKAYDLLEKVSTGITVEDLGQTPDVAIWLPEQQVEFILIRSIPEDVSVQIHLADGREFAANLEPRYGNKNYISGTLNRLRPVLRPEMRIDVDGATTYIDHPSFDAIVASYFSKDRG